VSALLRSLAGALSACEALRPVRWRSEASGKGGQRLGVGVIVPVSHGPLTDRGRPFNAADARARLCVVVRPAGTVDSAR
jgi:hypothetical protein